MLARTHFFFGMLFGVIFLPLIEQGSFFDFFVYFFIIELGAFIPDLDHPKVCEFFSLFFKHRGFLHTVFPVIILGFVVWKIFGFLYALPLILGYSSHLLGDALTVQGIRPLRPFLNFRIRGLLRTGSFTESVLFYVIILLILIRLYSFI